MKAAQVVVFILFWAAVIAWLGNAIGWLPVLYGGGFLAVILYICFKVINGGPKG